jgi:hypothetical protein
MVFAMHSDRPSVSECFLYREYYKLCSESRGARGGVVVKLYATNWQVAGSIPDGVIGIFR